jgi:hypothetical protein
MPTEDLLNGYENSTVEDQLFFTYSDLIFVEETVASRPFSRINLPEVKKLKASFEYNYYVVDERTAVQNDLLSLDPNNSANSRYNINASNPNGSPLPPRFIRLSFTKPSINSSRINEENLNLANQTSTFNRINFEGALVDKISFGFNLYDTGKESKLYKILRMNAFFRNINPDLLAPREIADRLHDTLTEKGGLRGEDKKLLYEVFANIQEEGYEVANTDIKKDIMLSSKDTVSTQKFGIKLHAGHISDVLNNSNIICDTVFGDELRSMEEVALETRANVLNNQNYFAANFNELDYVFNLKPAARERLQFQIGVDEGFESIAFVGYYIEKYVIDNNGSSRLVGRQVISNTNTNVLKDTDVSYGRVYRYIVRTLFNVKYIEREGSIHYRANFLVASKGEIKTINCIEREHPDPPEGLRFKFDYRLLKPHIHWQFPLNKQRDIKKFQVFKRMSINQPFQVIAEIDFDNSTSRTIYNEKILSKNYYRTIQPVLSFLDTSHKEGERPIYCVACVDAHGNSSNYSAQYQIFRNKLTNVVTRRLISRKNAPKSFPNFYINSDSFQDVIRASGYDRIKLFFEPEYYRVDKNSIPGDNSSSQIDQKLLAIDEDNPRYLFHFINIDNDKDAKLFIKIEDQSTYNAVDQDYFQAGGRRAAAFNPASFTFE